MFWSPDSISPSVRRHCAALETDPISVWFSVTLTRSTVSTGQNMEMQARLRQLGLGLAEVQLDADFLRVDGVDGVEQPEHHQDDQTPPRMAQRPPGRPPWKLVASAVENVFEIGRAAPPRPTAAAAGACPQGPAIVAAARRPYYCPRASDTFQPVYRCRDLYREAMPADQRCAAERRSINSDAERRSSPVRCRSTSGRVNGLPDPRDRSSGKARRPPARARHG